MDSAFLLNDFVSGQREDPTRCSRVRVLFIERL